MTQHNCNIQITLIAAVATNGVIGANNQLIWHLPADLRFFKSNTMHKSIIMGRKTFESIGKALPNRKNIIVSSNQSFRPEGCFTADSLPKALELAEGPEAMIIGGASLYKQAMEFAHKLIITEVHQTFAGDTYFPNIDAATWIETGREFHQKDDKNPFDYSFVTYQRR